MIQRFRQLSMRRKAMAILILVLAGSGVVLGAVRLGKKRKGENNKVEKRNKNLKIQRKVKK